MMTRLRNAALGLFALAALPFVAAHAQNVTPPPYPDGGIPVGISASGTTGAVTATLPAVAGRTTFICSFIVTSGGTTSAAVVNATITGTTFGTLQFEYVFVSSGQGVLGAAFPYCIPATAQNTTIALVLPAGGAGTVVSVILQGYQMRGSPPS